MGPNGKSSFTMETSELRLLIEPVSKYIRDLSIGHTDISFPFVKNKGRKISYFGIEVAEESERSWLSKTKPSQFTLTTFDIILQL